MTFYMIKNYFPHLKEEIMKKKISYFLIIYQKEKEILLLNSDLHKEKTKDYLNDDIKAILKKYKENISNSKLKKKLKYAQDFNPDNEKNINYWLIDMVLADALESKKLINKILEIIDDNKKAFKYKENEIIELLIFGLYII